MRSRSGPNGLHLFDRLSGLNVLLDEVAIPPSQWARAPRYVSIALTNACELACPYCYASKAPANARYAQVVSWVQALDTEGCFGVGFGGGEPTLYPGFSNLCHDVRATTGVAISFTTHGHRFSEELVDGLRGNVDFIRLSMDGLGETYERLRGRPFDVFREKLQLVRQTARFGINYVVNSDTIGNLPDAADFAFDNGAFEFLILPETGPGGVLTIDDASLDRLRGWVSRTPRRVRLATSEHAAEAIRAPVLPTAATDSSREFMHIDAFGRLKLTAFSQEWVSLVDGRDVLEGVEQVRLLEATKTGGAP